MACARVCTTARNESIARNDSGAIEGIDISIAWPPCERPAIAKNLPQHGQRLMVRTLALTERRATPACSSVFRPCGCAAF